MIYLLKKTFKHMFHFHTWSKWTEIERGEIKQRSPYDCSGTWFKVGVYIRQTRVCETCGMIQIRKIDA